MVISKRKQQSSTYDVGTDIKHSSSLVLLLQKVVEGVVGAVGSVVKSKTESVGL